MSNPLKLQEFAKLTGEDYLQNKKSSLHIWGLIRVIHFYYKYSLASYEMYKEQSTDYWKASNESGSLHNKIIASVFGVYTNGNVCLKVTRNINDYIRNYSKKKSQIYKELTRITESRNKWVKEFTERRNTIVIHPVNDNEKDSFPQKHVQLTGIAEKNGKGSFRFIVSSLITNHTEKEYTISIEDEINNLHDYLEELAPIYNMFFMKE